MSRSMTLDRFGEPRARVVALRHDVREALLDDDLDLHPRVPCTRRGQHGIDDEWQGRARNR
jgi:hypothetical protein